MKITIVGGAGGVGASVAFNLLAFAQEHDPALWEHDVVLVDRRPEMVESHVLDLEQTLVQGFGRTVRAGDGADIADSDVLVVTAAVPLRLNSSRLVFLNDNAAIVGEVIDRLPVQWDGVLILVTNPVDPLLTWVHRRLGSDRRRLLGYTLNDSLRLRTGISRTLAVEPSSVDGWVLGEHGDRCFPVWDRTTVDGRPVTLSVGQRAEAEEFLRTWYQRHVALDSGRTSTWTSGLGVARMVAAITGDTGELWPASIVLQGEYGVDGVAVSVPIALGRGGAREVYTWALSPDEQVAMEAACSAIRDQVDAIASTATTHLPAPIASH